MKRQFCTFYMGPRLLGIDVLKIQEVLRFQSVTLVPLAPPVVRGLLNLRGSIVTAIDLRRRLGMNPLEEGAIPANIVCQTADGPVSFLVDRVGDVVEVEAQEYEPPPDTLQGNARDLIEGVYKLNSGLLSILNVERTLELEPAI